jgi:CelD/BcsL family acetyltransferase involved in cellulose biosynthesis
MTIASSGTEQVESIVESEVGKLTVRETNPHRDSRWEAFVKQHPAASIYHHPAWLAALESEYKQEGVYLICESDAGEVVGLFPLMYTRGLPFGQGRPLAGPRLASLPRTPLAGPLTADSRATVMLIQEAVRRAASRNGGVRLQIKPPDRTLTGFSELAEELWRFTYILQLPEKTDQPFRVSNSKTRAKITWSVNKAVSNGVSVRLAENENDLRAWYVAYLETMRRNVVPARPYRFFVALWQVMQKNGLMKLYLAEQKSAMTTRIVAGHFYFYLGRMMTYAFSAARTADLSLRPNDIILWQAINDAQQNGYRTVDLGEVPEGDDSLAQFKSKWGAEQARLYRYYYPGFPDKDHSSGGADSAPVRMAKEMWRKLPLGLTAWLGDCIFARL